MRPLRVSCNFKKPYDCIDMTDDRRLVWDLPLRLFHWLLVTSIIASYVTAKLGFDWMQWHFYLGYGTIGLPSSGNAQGFFAGYDGFLIVVK